MPTQSAQFDLATAFLDQPKTLAYGFVRGAGNLVFQHELADHTRVAFYLLGEGPWDSLLRIWINRAAVALPDATKVHFHPGGDGEIGYGMAAGSTGGDQHVDAFFASVPGGLDPVTWSRYAYIGLKVPPDPAAPSADLEVLADYQAMKCRIFDAGGSQTSFAWTQNPAWWICDFLIRKFILREGKAGQPLVAAERARFDWVSFTDAAAHCDADIGGGVKRFSDGGLVFLDNGLTADRVLEQMLLMCRSYLLERNGKISLYADKARASVFTFTSDNVEAMSLAAKKSNLRAGRNRISASFRDLNLAAGSADNATRFASATQKVDHESHQRAIGVRGPGLSVIPKVQELQLDLAVNTPERAWRICQHHLVRQLGDEADVQAQYVAPFGCEWIGFEDSLAVEPGDVVTVDPSLSEEFAGKLIEVLEVEERPDGTRGFTGLEYMPNAFPDAAPAQQQTQAPAPGTGLPPVEDLDPTTGAPFVPAPDVRYGSGTPVENLKPAEAGADATGSHTAYDTARVGGDLAADVKTGAARARTALDANNQLADTFRNNPVDALYTIESGLGLSQQGTTKTINVAAGVVRWGSGTKNYNSGSVVAPTYDRWFVYADDPTYAGGAVAFVVTYGLPDLLSNRGRLYLGVIALATGGGGAGGGPGGSGPGSGFAGGGSLPAFQ